MGRVFVHMSVSLDGFFEDADGDISWGLVDAEVHGFINDTLRGVPTYLLGRRTYELMQAHWPTADENPDAAPEEIDFAQIWRATQKVVASRTLDQVWPGDVLVRDVDAELVRSLAEKGDVGVGGPELAAQVIELGLVDELLLNVHPVVLGGGRPLFAPGTRLELRLLGSHVFVNGVVHLRYGVGR